MESILFVNWYANRSGGADSYTHDLALGLANRGHNVSIACIDATAEARSRVATHSLRRPSVKTMPVVWRFDPVVQLAALAIDIARLPSKQPSMVINSLPFAAAPLWRRYPTSRHIYFPHALISPVEVAGYQTGFAAQLSHVLYSRTELQAIIHSSATIRFTHHNADVMKRFYKLSGSDHFDVIPPAVSFPNQWSRGPATNCVRLLFVGRLVASKNVAFLLKALSIDTQHPWTLDIVGDGPERTPLESLAKDFNIAGRVRFHGHQQDLSRYYQSADLFAFPSLLENLGLVMLEAMAHGLPVLAFRNDGNRFRNCSHEFIASGKDGLLADNESQFAMMLNDVLTNPGQLETLGLKARTRVSQNYTWPVVLKRWHELFARLHLRNPR